MIPHSSHTIDESDIAAVSAALRSAMLSPGPDLTHFESTVAEYCGARFAVAFSSGTAALHAAVHAAGGHGGHSGITSPLSFIASANCMVYAGMRPYFCDIEPLTMNMDPTALATALRSDTKIIIPVHYAGVSCDMERIAALARTRNTTVIEDGAHALGARTPNGPVGNCAFSDMVCFSLHPLKSITTGEGGLVTTNQPDLHERLTLFRSHGLVRNANNRFPDEGPWYMEMQDLGFNYRTSNFQAALGLSQLQKIESFISRREDIHRRYDQAFRALPGVIVPHIPEQIHSAHHIYVVRLDNSIIHADRREIVESLRQAGIGTQVHYVPIHLHHFYRTRFGYHAGMFPQAEAAYASMLSLPLYPKMTDDEIEQVIGGFSDVISRATQ